MKRIFLILFFLVSCVQVAHGNIDWFTIPWRCLVSGLWDVWCLSDDSNILYKNWTILTQGTRIGEFKFLEWTSDILWTTSKSPWEWDIYLNATLIWQWKFLSYKKHAGKIFIEAEQNWWRVLFINWVQHAWWLTKLGFIQNGYYATFYNTQTRKTTIVKNGVSEIRDGDVKVSMSYDGSLYLYIWRIGWIVPSERWIDETNIPYIQNLEYHVINSITFHPTTNKFIVRYEKDIDIHPRREQHTYYDGMTYIWDIATWFTKDWDFLMLWGSTLSLNNVIIKDNISKININISTFDTTAFWYIWEDLKYYYYQNWQDILLSIEGWRQWSSYAFTTRQWKIAHIDKNSYYFENQLLWRFDSIDKIRFSDQNIFSAFDTNASKRFVIVDNKKIELQWRVQDGAIYEDKVFILETEWRGWDAWERKVLIDENYNLIKDYTEKRFDPRYSSFIESFYLVRNEVSLTLAYGVRTPSWQVHSTDIFTNNQQLKNKLTSMWTTTFVYNPQPFPQVWSNDTTDSSGSTNSDSGSAWNTNTDTNWWSSVQDDNWSSNNEPSWSTSNSNWSNTNTAPNSIPQRKKDLERYVWFTEQEIEEKNNTDLKVRRWLAYNDTHWERLLWRAKKMHDRYPSLTKQELATLVIEKSEKLYGIDDINAWWVKNSLFHFFFWIKQVLFRSDMD